MRDVMVSLILIPQQPRSDADTKHLLTEKCRQSGGTWYILQQRFCDTKRYASNLMLTGCGNGSQGATNSGSMSRLVGVQLKM